MFFLENPVHKEFYLQELINNSKSNILNKKGTYRQKYIAKTGDVLSHASSGMRLTVSKEIQDEFEVEDDPYKIFMNFYKKMDDMEARNEPSQKKKFG